MFVLNEEHQEGLTPNMKGRKLTCFQSQSYGFPNNAIPRGLYGVVRLVPIFLECINPFSSVLMKDGSLSECMYAGIPNKANS